MSSDDDWMRALAGQGADGPDTAAAQEARLLREALRAQVRPAAELSDAEADRLMSAVLAGAVRRAPRRRRFCQGCLLRWQAWWRADGGRGWPAAGLAGAALAVLAGVIVLVPLATEAPDERGVMRSASTGGLTVVADPQPLARRDRLGAELAACGAEVQAYERRARYGLDAQFSLPLTPTAVACLKRLALAPDAEGVVRVEVVTAVP